MLLSFYILQNQNTTTVLEEFCSIEDKPNQTKPNWPRVPIKWNQLNESFYAILLYQIQYAQLN